MGKEMKQRGLFDEIERLHELSKLGDPLLVLAEKINWESFRPILKKIRIENPENYKALQTCVWVNNVL